MGNHCIDVGCTKCGRVWCIRCHDYPEAPPKDGLKGGRIKMAMERGALQLKDIFCCDEPVIML